ncbi:MAG: hypothetical protein NVS2B16_24840 [Chloroflexota bacterium]
MITVILLDDGREFLCHVIADRIDQQDLVGRKIEIEHAQISQDKAVPLRGKKRDVARGLDGVRGSQIVSNKNLAFWKYVPGALTGGDAE